MRRIIPAITLVLLGLAGSGPVSSAQDSAIPNFSPSSDVGWIAYGTEFIPNASGPKPVTFDPAHPYVPDCVEFQFGDPNRKCPNTPTTFRVADLSNPILRPTTREALRKRNAEVLGGKLGYTRVASCWPLGVPAFVLYAVQPIFFVQSPREVVMTWQAQNIVRRIYLNVPHAVRPTPSWFGDSVGHYEGDTLVIDTVGVKVGPFAMVDMYGTPHSPALHVVERYRLVDYEAAKEAAERDEKDNVRLPDYLNDAGVAVDPNYKGKGLQLQFTVEDEGVFTVPWSATITYRRAANEWYEQVCAENTRRTGAYGDTGTVVPEADKPDF